MKKLSQKILSSFPLIWNTRLFLILPVIIGLHILFFIAGIFREFSYTDQYYNSDIAPTGVAVFLAILFGLLLFIGWMVHYFRNNALKSLYPIASPKLFGEYLIVLLVCVGCISFIESYRLGSLLKYNRTFNNVDVKEEANIINQASYFLAFDFNKFHKSQSCDLRKDDGYYETTTDDAVSYNNGQQVPDSVGDFSYLNYCSQAVYLGYNRNDIPNTRAMHEVAARWLKQGKRDSVKAIINKYIAIVKEYGGQSNIDVDRWVNEIFSTPDFRVKRLLKENKSYSGDNEEYMEINNAVSRLQMINSQRASAEFGTEWMILFIIAMCISIAIFSFRLTKIRTWFIALIGSCLWGIIFGLLAFVLSGSGSAFIVCYLMIYFGVSGYAVANILSRTSKQAAGVCFIWMQWALPTILPCILALSRMDRSYGSGYHESWVDHNWDVIMYLNITLTIAVMAFGVIPFAKQWQALPEE